MEFLSLALGFVLLAAGGEYLVRSAVSLAHRLGVPALLIGISVVAAATSAPELFVSIRSAAGGSPGIAVGNVVGSNIANLALGLGIMGLVMPFAAPRHALARDMAALIIASVAFLGLGLSGVVGRLAGAAMLAALVFYVWLSYERERGRRGGAAAIREEQTADLRVPWSPWLASTVFVISVAALLSGAELLVSGAVSLASAAGVSDAVIGVSVVALGTSLPELATTVVAARRGDHDVALGNLLGSSLFNLLAIIGATAVIAPVPVSRAFLVVSGTAMLALTLAVAPVFTGRWRVGRLSGALLILGYGVYVLFVTTVVPA